MPDPNVLIRTYLLQDAALLTMLGAENIFAGILPQGFDVEDTPAVVITGQGGSSFEDAPITRDFVQVRVWAGIDRYQLAREIYGEIWKWLHGKTQIDLGDDGFILSCMEVVRGRDLADPDPGWVSVISLYQVASRDSSGTPPAPATPTFYEGDGPPETLHNDADIYFDTFSGDIYEQRGGVWVGPIGNIPVGGETEMPSLTYHKVSAASDNAHNIKASAGTVTGWKIYNNAPYPIYVKLYDKATLPSPSSDTPKQTLGVEAGLSDVLMGAGTIYSSGIGIAIVKGIADNDDAPVGAADCVVDIFYQ